MMTARIAGLLALGLCLSATTSLMVSAEEDNKKHAESDSSVVAEVGSKTLTMADLQEKEGGKLLQAEYQFYLQQQRAVEDLINDQLLSDEAKKRNISQEQLLAEVYKEVKDPTEDQLQVYYEGMDSKEPYEAVRGDVLQH